MKQTVELQGAIDGLQRDPPLQKANGQEIDVLMEGR